MKLYNLSVFFFSLDIFFRYIMRYIGSLYILACHQRSEIHSYAFIYIYILLFYNFIDIYLTKFLAKYSKLDKECLSLKILLLPGTTILGNIDMMSSAL